MQRFWIFMQSVPPSYTTDVELTTVVKQFLSFLLLFLKFMNLLETDHIMGITETWCYTVYYIWLYINSYTVC